MERLFSYYDTILLAFILVCFPGTSLHAQLLQPVYSAPSPEAATLSEFGQIPVSHFTGQPEVSIPIYEIEAGDFKYPIALSYSLASVKARSRIYNYDRQANVTMVSTGNFPAGAQAFSYSGNHLSSVGYDADGNAVADSLSGIRSAGLNVLDRMGTVVHTLRLGQSAPDTVRYLYAADGTKLRETVLRPSGSGAVDTVRTDYVGHLIYRDGELAMILVAGGFVAAADEMLSQFLPRPQGTGIDDLPSVYAFYWKDHLGSVRAVSDIYGNVLQAHTYDPYGNEIVGETAPSTALFPTQQTSFVPEWDVIGTRMDNPFAFSGKERLDSAGLSLYDFGARNFSVGNAPRWTTMDPLCEKYYSISPYAYCAGDPVNLVDPCGAWIWNEKGDLISEKNDDIGTLASFLHISLNEAVAMIRRNTPDFRKMTPNYVLYKDNIWTESIEKSSIRVSNTVQAWNHYKNGNGEIADVGRRAQEKIMSTSVFKKKYSEITNNLPMEQDGSENVDLTNKVFHIGNTNFRYIINKGNSVNSVTFIFFSQDSFSDPLFILENNKSKDTRRHRDSLGPNLEMGGTPYYYAQRRRTYYFKPSKNEKND